MRGLRWVVATLGEVLVTIGLLVLLFVAWQLWWTDVTAEREQVVAVQSLERGFDHEGLQKPEPTAPTTPAPSATPKKIPVGKAFGIIRIPRFGGTFSRPVLEGTDRDTLVKGVGHYLGSAMPGEVGNLAMAGHRTTYGRPFHDIDRLRKGDVIVIETKDSYYVYAVDRHVIVTPNQVEVIAPTPQRPGVAPTEAWLTMTACHPKYSAEKRYVVFAQLAETFSRAQGLPAPYKAVPKPAAT